jgi:hypothetical protein
VGAAASRAEHKQAQGIGSRRLRACQVDHPF